MNMNKKLIKFIVWIPSLRAICGYGFALAVTVIVSLAINDYWAYLLPSCNSDWQYRFMYVCKSAPAWSYAKNWVLNLCSPWAYQDEIWKWVCKQAPIWSYTVSKWAIRAEKCPKWTYSQSAWNSICQPAKAWQYVDSVWASNFKNCSSVVNWQFVNNDLKLRGNEGYYFNQILRGNYIDWKDNWIWAPDDVCPIHCNDWFSKTYNWSVIQCLRSESAENNVPTSDIYSDKLNELRLIYSRILFSESQNRFYSIKDLNGLLFDLKSMRLEIDSASKISVLNLSSKINEFDLEFNAYVSALNSLTWSLVTLNKDYANAISASNYGNYWALEEMIREINNINVNWKLALLITKYLNWLNIFNLYQSSLLSAISNGSLSSADKKAIRNGLKVAFNNRFNEEYVHTSVDSDDSIAQLIFNSFVVDWMMVDYSRKPRAISAILSDIWDANNWYVVDNFNGILANITNPNWDKDDTRIGRIIEKVKDLATKMNENALNFELWTFAKWAGGDSLIVSNVKNVVLPKSILKSPNIEYVDPNIAKIIAELWKEWKAYLGQIFDMIDTSSDELFANNIKSSTWIRLRSDLIKYIDSQLEASVSIKSLFKAPIKNLLDSYTNLWFYEDLASGTLSSEVLNFSVNSPWVADIDIYEQTFWKMATLNMLSEQMEVLVVDYNLLSYVLNSVDKLWFIKWCEPWRSRILEDGYSYASPDFKIPCSKRQFKEYVDTKRRALVDWILRIFNQYKSRYADYIDNIQNTWMENANTTLSNDWNLICRPESSKIWDGCIDLTATKIEWYWYWPGVWAVVLDAFKCWQKAHNDLVAICSSKTSYTDCPIKTDDVLVNICKIALDSFRIVDEDWKIKFRWYMYSTELWPIKFNDLSVDWRLDAVINSWM